MMPYRMSPHNVEDFGGRNASTPDKETLGVRGFQRGDGPTGGTRPLLHKRCGPFDEGEVFTDFPQGVGVRFGAVILHAPLQGGQGADARFKGRAQIPSNRDE
jgi:hypothetical protein